MEGDAMFLVFFTRNKTFNITYAPSLITSILVHFIWLNKESMISTIATAITERLRPHIISGGRISVNTITYISNFSIFSYINIV